MRNRAIWTQFIFFFSEEAAFCTVCRAKFSTRGGFTANLHFRHKHRTVQLTQIWGFSLFLLKITAAPALLQPAPPALFQILLLHEKQHKGLAWGAQAKLTYFMPSSIDSLRQRPLDEVLTKMIALDFQTSSIVKDSGFWRFWLVLNHNYVFPSLKSPSKTITWALYKKPHDRVNGSILRFF